MNKKLTQAEADQHNILYKQGWEILNDNILLADRGQVKIGIFTKQRLKKAIRLFHEALAIAPDNYSSKWALGKIYQALGNHTESLKWFEAACLLEQGNPDVYREAHLAAMDCAEFTKALDYVDKAVALQPDDAGLHCNRALALMFLKRDGEAIEAVVSSLQLDPQDTLTLNVRALIHAVVDGARPRPETMTDLR